MALKKEEIKELSTEELVEKVQEEKVLLKKMEFEHVLTAVENPLLIRDKRRDIARLYTELRRRELESSEN